METFNLERYLSKGVENIVKGMLKTSLTNPKQSLYFAKYVAVSKHAIQLRRKSEETGEHVPPFLIASITSKCNLSCSGCYARANEACGDSEVAADQLKADEWLSIFQEAKDMGIGFILLAGGEPLMRRDVIEVAAKVPELIFPIFTNGTLIHNEYLEIFDNNRNLIPVLSIEGEETKTDQRRGAGVYKKLLKSMEQLRLKKLLFAASVTVTTENREEVMSHSFVKSLEEQGCKGIIYIEYVPVTLKTKHLAFTEGDRVLFMKSLEHNRTQFDNVVFIAFPGDEKSSGGCLAAGRGFFHINATGGVEPCPFSPYSDTNLREVSLKEAMKSQLFRKLQEHNLLMEDHIGGCILFEQRDKVEAFLK